MNPQTLQAFQHEMRKLAAESEKKALSPSKKDEELVENTRMGILGGSVGAYAIVQAQLKSSAQPGTQKEMVKHVDRMARSMKLPEKVFVSVPKAGGRGDRSPFYLNVDSADVAKDLEKHSKLPPKSVAIGKYVNTPLNIRDAVIAHELGHAKTDMLLSQLGDSVYKSLKTLMAGSRTVSPWTVVPLTSRAATDEKMSYTPGIIQAILSSPMLADEAVASAIATTHLIKQHGVGKGVWRSLPLVPAFATYAALGGAPLLVTYLRRRAATKELQGKEKSSTVLEKSAHFRALFPT